MIGPLPWIGGKRVIANQIIQLFPEHTTYVEPFCGGAQVYFHKAPSKVEVLNDRDDEIVNFFRVCQLHSDELIRYLRFSIASRSWFDLLLRTDPKTLTDVQRAARFLYLAKNTYAGLVRHRNYKANVTQPSNFNPERIPQILEEAHERLTRTQIENLPYEEVLRRYDRPTTLSYLDPPYYGVKLYRYNLNPADFSAMAEVLGKLRGKFVLSLNDVPEVRAIFNAFRIRGIEMSYSVQRTSGRRFREVIITNF